MPIGLNEYVGNIDLNHRKVYNHPKGYIQTEESIGYSPDGNTEVLIPTVIEGKPTLNLPEGTRLSDLNPEAQRAAMAPAIRHYQETGEHLGKVDKAQVMKDKGMTEEQFYRDYWEPYAVQVHERQDRYYHSPEGSLAKYLMQFGGTDGK